MYEILILIDMMEETCNTLYLCALYLLLVPYNAVVKISGNMKSFQSKYLLSLLYVCAFLSHFIAQKTKRISYLVLELGVLTQSLINARLGSYVSLVAESIILMHRTHYKKTIRKIL